MPVGLKLHHQRKSRPVVFHTIPFGNSGKLKTGGGACTKQIVMKRNQIAIGLESFLSVLENHKLWRFSEVDVDHCGLQLHFAFSQNYTNEKNFIPSLKLQHVSESLSSLYHGYIGAIPFELGVQLRRYLLLLLRFQFHIQRLEMEAKNGAHDNRNTKARDADSKRIAVSGCPGGLPAV